MAAPVFENLRDAQNLVLKESFENLRETKGWNVLQGDVVGDNGIVWNTYDNGLEVQKGIVSKSADGEVHIELDAHHNVTISTKVMLKHSKKHVLKLSIKPRAKNGKKNTSAMQISLGDDVVSIVSDAHGKLTSNYDTTNISVHMKETADGWTRVLIQYPTVEKGRNTFVLKGRGSDDSYGMLVDDISLRCITQPTQAIANLCEEETSQKVILKESFENLRDEKGWHVAYGEVTGDHDAVWDTYDNGLELQREIISESAEGKVHAELDAHHNVTISTELELMEDRRYRLVVFIKPRGLEDHNKKQETSGIDITLGDTTVSLLSDKRGQLTQSIAPSKITVKMIKQCNGWTKVTIAYKHPEAGTNVLKFEGTSTDDSYGMLLDNITMVRVKYE
jgi:hypothetical protein